MKNSLTFIWNFFKHNTVMQLPEMRTNLTDKGSCVLEASVDKVSVNTIRQYGDRKSTDISTDTCLICRLRLDRVLVNVLFDWIDCRWTLLVSMSVDTWVTPWPICCDWQLLAYQSTVGGIGVLLTVAETAAVCLPTEDAKKESVFMVGLSLYWAWINSFYFYLTPRVFVFS